MSFQDALEEGVPLQDIIEEYLLPDCGLNPISRPTQKTNQTTQGNIADCLTGKSNKTSGSTEQPEDKE